MTKEGEKRSPFTYSHEPRLQEQGDIRIVHRLPGSESTGTKKKSKGKLQRTERGVQAIIDYIKSGGKTHKNVHIVCQNAEDRNIYGLPGFLTIDWKFGEDEEGPWRYPFGVSLDGRKVSKRLILNISQAESAEEVKPAPQDTGIAASSVRTSPFTHGRHALDDVGWKRFNKK